MSVVQTYKLWYYNQTFTKVLTVFFSLFSNTLLLFRIKVTTEIYQAILLLSVENCYGKSTPPYLFLSEKNIQNVLSAMVLTLIVYLHSSVSLPLSTLVLLLIFFYFTFNTTKMLHLFRNNTKEEWGMYLTPHNTAWQSSNGNSPHIKNQTRWNRTITWACDPLHYKLCLISHRKNLMCSFHTW